MSISEDLIREAGWYESSLPKVAARGMKTWWPDIPVEKGEWAWFEAENSKLRCRINGRGDVYDFVMLNLLGAKSVLSVREKRLVWSRAGLRWGWQKIAHEHHTYRSRVKGLYDN